MAQWEVLQELQQGAPALAPKMLSNLDVHRRVRCCATVKLNPALSVSVFPARDTLCLVRGASSNYLPGRFVDNLKNICNHQ